MSDGGAAYRRAAGPLNLLIDSTGIKSLGDGEWQARKHGVQGRRQWRKVHLAMDLATSDIRAVEFTPSSDGDGPILPELLGQIPEDEQINTVTADGAYDTRHCHAAIREALLDKKISPCIPGRKSRDKPIKYDKRRFRKCNRIEITFRRLKDWRRVATRYERSPKVFLSTIALAATVIF